jgi:hypothetical protein
LQREESAIVRTITNKVGYMFEFSWTNIPVHSFDIFFSHSDTDLGRADLDGRQVNIYFTLFFERKTIS